MDNPWIQSIFGSLIAGLMVYLGKRALPASIPRHIVIFAVLTASVVFMFGSLLQPATQYFIEGNENILEMFSAMNQLSAAYKLSILFISGLFPGIATGLIVLRGRSLRSRILRGIFLAVASLSFFDMLVFLIAANYPDPNVQNSLGWSYVYFSLLSNIIGGAIGGLIVGVVVHFYITSFLRE